MLRVRILQLLLLASGTLVPARAAWTGPSKSIFASTQCAKTGTNYKVATAAGCETACAADAHCNAVNFNTDPRGGGCNKPGDGCCNFYCCAKAVAPSGAAPTYWVSYSDFQSKPTCKGRPPPPPPPPAPGSGTLVKLTAAVGTHGARCLDGSPAAYYFTKGSGSGADMWVVNLNGGGWCFTESGEYSDGGNSCWGRSGGSLGSSNGYRNDTASSRPPIPLTSPMGNWNQVNVIYCDGGSFSGNRDDAVPTPQNRWPDGSTSGANKTLWYRGRRNLNAVIDDLKTKGLGKASLAVLSGCSAGGLAALTQCNHFASRAGVPSKCVGDAGFFIDAVSIYEFRSPAWYTASKTVSLVRRQYSNVVHFMNSSLDESCLAHKDTNTFPGACFFPQNILKHGATPMFLRNSMYNYGEWEMTVGVCSCSCSCCCSCCCTCCRSWC